MLLNDFSTLKFDYDDVLIQTGIITPINTRSDINIYDENGMLPIYASPMIDVLNKDNIDVFFANKIYGIYPRSNWTKEYKFNGSGIKYSAHSLEEVKYFFIDNEFETENASILIDIANGHQQRLVDYIKILRTKYGNRINIMCGNIANPETFRILSEAGADGVRLGIGNGNACLTTKQTSIGYPMGSLVQETRIIKDKFNLKAEIIADGGIKDYSDIITALALGADKVMIGSLFAKTLESAALAVLDTNKPDETLTYDESLKYFESNTPIYKKFRGMSTKSVQKELGGTKLKTSEGVERFVKVEYSLSGWVENFEAYLKSMMSYTGKYDIKDYIGKVDYNLISSSAYKRFNK
jgi:hypothetical protein